MDLRMLLPHNKTLRGELQSPGLSSWGWKAQEQPQGSQEKPSWGKRRLGGGPSM